MSHKLPHLAHIFIFPIKSLDGVQVDRVTVLESGALKGDREFAIVDSEGNFVNGKRNPAVHRLRSQFDLAERTVSLEVERSGESNTFSLEGDRTPLEAWFSDYFGFPVELKQNQQVGFPDDLASPGPTIISVASLKTTASWFPELTMEDTRLRFRTNLEIDGVEPFWEDRLFAEADELVPFQMGQVAFNGVNPCQRCIVPTRNALTGESYHRFQKIFGEQREKSLPDWVERSRFNHFYRLAINTRVLPSQGGKELKVGDELLLN
jgi:uncharacterized protein YcbX